MDEEETLDKMLTSNGEGLANLLMNEDEEHQAKVTETDIDNAPKGEDVVAGLISVQNTSKKPEIEEKASTDPKPLNTPKNDGLTLSPESFMHANGGEPDDLLSEIGEDGPLSQDEGSSSGLTETSEAETEPELDGVLTNNYLNHLRLNANEAPITNESRSRFTNGEVYNHEVGSNGVPPRLKKAVSEIQYNRSNIRVGDIDTTAPFESVKEAVTMFGGLDWKAHKKRIAERYKYIAQELKKAQEEIPMLKRKSEASEEGKVQVLKELDTTKRYIEELKLNLERAETEELQARQDAELAKLRVEEMEQGIAENSSVAARAQLEVTHARHQTAVEELKKTKSEFRNLQRDYDLLASEKETAIKKANEAMSNSKEIEKEVERLTIKLITAKEALESAHLARLEAEERKIGVAMARDQDALYWEKELRQSEEELEKGNQQIVSTEDLKAKLNTASELLQNLKAELAAYMGENLDQNSKTNGDSHKDIQKAVDVAKTNLKQVKKNIQKTTNEVSSLKLDVTSLNSELQKEKATLLALRQREGMASVAVASLEADLKNTSLQIEDIQMKEKEARERTMELPKQFQKASEDAHHARSLAQKAHEELQKAKKAADQAKARATAMRFRLHAAQKEIEAARASERLALGEITALHESESSNKTESESGVTLSLEEYHELSKKAQEAEDQANSRVSQAISLIDVAKESELKALNKLDQINSDLALKKEQLSIAMQKVEMAKEGKLAVEQELRTWRSENEQRRKAKDDGGRRGVVGGGTDPKGTCGSSVEVKCSDCKPDVKADVTGSSGEGKAGKKKKRSLIPRILMFFRKKKGNSNKNR